MLKKHAFSPNHKVVTGSKHNFHPSGTEPTTAGQGAPPQQLHGGADGPTGAGDGTAGPVESFSDGGKCMADGDMVDRAAESASRAADYLTNSTAQKFDEKSQRAHDAAAPAKETPMDTADRMSK
jgi:hypothetical protein